MSLAKSIEKISQFGKEIQSNTAVSVPQIIVTPEETIELFKAIKFEENNDFDIGFYNIAEKYVASNWEKFNDSQKQQIREILLKSASTQINSKALHRFATLCTKVYQLSENWKEMVDFIFSAEEITVNKMKIFVLLVSASSEEFITAHFKDIVSFITKSLPVASPTLKESIINILSNIDCEAAFESEPTLLDIFMESLYAIVRQEPERQEFIIPVANSVFISAPKASEIVPKSVTDAILAMKDVETAAPVLALFPVYNAESVIALVTKLIAICEAMITEKKDLPVDLLLKIEDSPIEKLSDSVQEALAQFFESVLQTTANSSNVAIFAPLAAQVADVYGKEKFLAIVNSCFNGTNIQTAAALFVFQCVSQYIENLSFELPKSVLPQIFQYFGNEDECVRKYAFSAARKMFENKFPFDRETCQNLFDSFSSIPDSDFSKFFKVVRDAFRSEVNDEVLSECALPFALDGIKANQSPSKVAEYLSIIANIENVNIDLIEESSDAILKAASDLMNGDEATTYKYASRALLGLIHDDGLRAKVYALLPRFAQLVSKDSTLPTQIQGNVAAAYASVVIGTHVQKEIPRVVDIALRFVSSKDKYLISAGSLLAEMVVDTVKLEVSRQLFATISDAAQATTEAEQLNNLLEALEAIFEKSRVEEKAVIPLFTSFVTEQHPIFEGKAPYMFHDKETHITSYIKNCITRFPDLGEKAAVMITKWFSMAPTYMYPALLEVLSIVVEMKKVQESSFDLLAETLFHRVGTTHNNELDEEILSLLLELTKENPDLIDAQRFITKFTALFEALNDEECDDDDDENESSEGLRILLAAAILDMVSFGAEAEPDFVREILTVFPGTPEDGIANEMGSAIVRMMADGEKWSDIKPQVVTALSQLLLKPQEEYNKYEIEKDTTNGMKKLFKSILQKNKDLERELVKSFNKNRPLQNRFSKLMK